MAERETYEAGWAGCERCGCRRPLSGLRLARVSVTAQPDAKPPLKVNFYACDDLGWCSEAGKASGRAP